MRRTRRHPLATAEALWRPSHVGDHRRRRHYGTGPRHHKLSTWTKLRLGFRETAAGMASVLILGVFNRAMKVELGISLIVVATVLASYNRAAPAALAIGHRSDQRPILGRHRSPTSSPAP